MTELSLDQLGLILIFLVLLIVAILAGLIWYVVSSGRKKAAPRPLPAGPAPPDLPFGPGGPRLSLVRDEGGPLQVEVAGVRFSGLAEVRDPEVKRQIVLAAVELVRFTGVLGNDVPAPAPIDQTYRWREDVRDESRDKLKEAQRVSRAAAPGTPTQAEIEQQFLTLVEKLGRSSPPDKPNLVNSIQRVLKPKEPGDQPRTFVDDIEQIIQRRIRLIPAFQGRELHVRTDPAGAVRFDFDGHDYPSADDIPNTTARQIVAEAIREWEESS